jgi:hypothetical protein
MKTFITTCLSAGLLVLAGTFANGQSLLGTWQLVKQTKCIESELGSSDNSEEDLVAEMKSQSGPYAQVIRFREKGAGDESGRVLNRKKTTNSKNFLYKHNGETLLILDKKSQTIAETFSIDKLSADSLILSNATRSCDIQIFVKIREPK